VRIGGVAVGLPGGVFALPWSRLEGKVLQVGKRRFARIQA